MQHRHTKRAHLLALAAACAILFAIPGRTAELEKGDVSLDLDTGVSYGLTMGELF